MEMAAAEFGGVLMTLEEAKEFYFAYAGHSFHMDREEPVKYNAFMQLNLEEGILKQWDEELLDRLFENLWSNPARVWASHGSILSIIGRQRCDVGQYLAKLLNEMEKMEQLDAFNITLIIENMAGRTESMSDGGAYLFCRHSSLAESMNAVMERIIDAYSGNNDVDDRFRTAVHRYRCAYGTWRH